MSSSVKNTHTYKQQKVDIINCVLTYQVNQSSNILRKLTLVYVSVTNTITKYVTNNSKITLVI